MTDAIPRRKQVALGLVGMGPLWDDVRGVLRRRGQHMVVRGTHDAVPVKAEQLARECQAVAATSLTQLYERADIDAVLVLDGAWHGWFPCELACRYRKPTLMFGPWAGDEARLEQVQHASREAAVLLMAALPRRHVPATNRLRELIATKLGLPHRITIEMRWPRETAFQQLIDWIDWCSAVLGRHASAATCPATASADARQIDILFPASAAEADIRWQQAAADEQSLSIRVECQHGTAIISSATEIAWTVGEVESRDSLAADRSSTEIILDQFCRRVVGGLVPVADVGDVLRSLKLARGVWPAVTPHE